MLIHVPTNHPCDVKQTANSFGYFFAPTNHPCDVKHQTKSDRELFEPTNHPCDVKLLSFNNIANKYNNLSEKSIHHHPKISIS